MSRIGGQDAVLQKRWMKMHDRYAHEEIDLAWAGNVMIVFLSNALGEQASDRGRTLTRVGCGTKLARVDMMPLLLLLNGVCFY